MLLEAHAVADAAGDRHEATRALGNLGFTLMWWMEPEPALGYEQQALAYAQEHEVHNLASYCATMVAWLRLRAGEWERSRASVTKGEIERGITVVQLLAKTVLTELAVRRGDPDAARHGSPTSRPRPTAPASRSESRRSSSCRAEWALTHGEPMPVERLEKFLDEIEPPGRFATRSPPGPSSPDSTPDCDQADAGAARRDAPPRLAGRRRRLRATSAGAYDRALMLSLLDDEAGAGRGDRDRARARRRAAHPAGRRPHAGARAARSPGTAGDDAGEPGRAHGAPGRGARAPLRRADERRDRRAAGRVGAHRRAPRGRGAAEAPGERPARGRSPGFRAGPRAEC